MAGFQVASTASTSKAAPVRLLIPAPSRQRQSRLLGAGGSVTNAASASIMGLYYGVETTGGAGTVVNSGTIAATDYAGMGVYLKAGGSQLRFDLGPQ
jgi:hypothetical protein